ncbi:adenine deaminase [Bacillus xiamenensis]|uniref:Adenine deaminase n=1 Tax=Bacillus xiamenensis TaxID=1178537 RepID=A0ABT4F200_9BACI|nr:adenine deaminase [Bacillus xiamenensis]EKF36236.1 adenine deaminase [Bacillus xiamenensis]MBG9912480.1 adenine deaminase [Bacillus xiamenensis]MCY9576076.1 adenine deaminase [Bacillus xiamenensis]
MDKELFRHQIEVAAKRKKAALVIKHAKVMDVFNQEWIDADVAVENGKIVGIGEYEGERELDAAGQMLVPGFIDGHVHIESSMVTPAEFSKAVVPHGVTTVVTDPHEIANVSGVAGIRFMLKEARKAALNIYFMLPSCVPAVSFERSGATLKAKDLKPLYEEKEVLGLAEVMDYVGVEQAEEDMLQKLLDAQHEDKLIDGHLAGLTDRLINVYRTANVQTDHEVTTAQEALERVKRGMYVMLREGSVAKNVKNVLPAVNEKNARRFFFCTDDKHLDDLLAQGSIDEQVRMSIKEGLDPFLAYQMGSLNAAECFDLKTKGAIAPGFDADFMLISDLNKVDITSVFIAGELVSEHGEYQPRVDKVTPNLSLMKSVHAVDVQEKDLTLPIRDHQKMNVIRIIPNQLETKLEQVSPSNLNGQFTSDTDRDVLKMVLVERHQGLSEIGVGIVSGFGLKNGAIATTVAHDSHNLIAVGTNDADMIKAIETLKEAGGGLTVVKGGQPLHTLPLPISGLLSDQPAHAVNESLHALHEALNATGFSLDFNPFLTLSFLALPVIPDVKMTTKGLFDVRSFQHLPIQS